MLCCLYCHYIEEIHEISVTKVLEGSKCPDTKKFGETPRNFD